jgi:hypothetical protein
LVAAAEARQDEAIRPLLKVIVPDYGVGGEAKPLPTPADPVVVGASVYAQTVRPASVIAVQA